MAKKDFNEFRFGGLNNRYEVSNQYMTMDRVSEDENKIIVKVAAEHLIQTKYGYALILDRTHVVFVKEWAVDENWFGNEVLLTREFWNVKEWGVHDEFDDEPQNLDFNTWLNAAKEQDKIVEDEDGYKTKLNPVKWRI